MTAIQCRSSSALCKEAASPTAHAVVRLECRPLTVPRLLTASPGLAAQRVLGWPGLRGAHRPLPLQGVYTTHDTHAEAAQHHRGALRGALQRSSFPERSHRPLVPCARPTPTACSHTASHTAWGARAGVEGQHQRDCPRIRQRLAGGTCRQQPGGQRQPWAALRGGAPGRAPAPQPSHALSPAPSLRTPEFPEHLDRAVTVGQSEPQIRRCLPGCRLRTSRHPLMPLARG